VAALLRFFLEKEFSVTSSILGPSAPSPPSARASFSQTIRIVHPIMLSKRDIPVISPLVRAWLGTEEGRLALDEARAKTGVKRLYFDEKQGKIVVVAPSMAHLDLAGAVVEFRLAHWATMFLRDSVTVKIPSAAKDWFDALVQSFCTPECMIVVKHIGDEEYSCCVLGGSAIRRLEILRLLSVDLALIIPVGVVKDSRRSRVGSKRPV